MSAQPAEVVLGSADSSGVLSRLAYAINNGLTVGAKISYGNTFDAHVSAGIMWRFNANVVLAKTC